MNNFVFQNPTSILFGKGMIRELRRRVPRDVPVMLLYGGGSIRKNGVYEQVKQALGDIVPVELGGIEPNPLYETCMKAVEQARAHRVGFLLSVGGGSVLDATKFIAAAVPWNDGEDGDPWRILSDNAPVRAALPIGAVLTLPATGSESNGNSVISRRSTQEKLAFGSPLVYPVFSVLDPETTFSLPRRQVRNGVVDAFVHVMEQYATYPAAAPLQDRFCESVVQTLVEVGPVTVERPTDYEPRAAFMWAATMALNGLIGAGVPQDWTTHMIGHELTAFYGVDHAESLAVVMPGLWHHRLQQKREKLESLGQRVFGVAGAAAAVGATERFFLSLGMPVRLSDYKIDAEDAAKRVSERLRARGAMLGEHRDVSPDDVAAILRSRA